MFSVCEKRLIAEKIEKILLELNHPEMPKEKPTFKLLVDGKESWSWAEIVPNWLFRQPNGVKPNHNTWNEVAREIMSKNKED